MFSRSDSAPRLAAVAIFALSLVARAQSPAKETDALRREARAAAAAAHTDEALAAYARAIEQSPRDATLRAELGGVLANAAKFPEAIASYQEALKISPRDLSAQMGLAASYRGLRNFEDSKRAAERAARDHPRSAAPLALLGDIEIELQTYDAAIRDLRAALALDPANNETRNRLAAAYKAKGDSTSALAQVDKVLARDSQNALAHYLRAEIYSDRNDDAKALPDAEKAVALQPKNPSARLALGKILLRVPAGAAPEDAAARCARAVDTLEPVAQLLRENSESLFLLSRAYQCAAQPERAKETLAAFEAASQQERAKREGEQRSLHLVKEAEERALKNDPAGALGLAQQALEKDPSNGLAYSLMAKIFYSAGDLVKATDAISKALERGPNQPDFLYVKGKILERQGKLDEALAAFEQTALVNPRESDAYFEIGAICEQRGDRARALAAYKKAAALSPDEPDYRRALESLSKSAPPH